MSRAFSLSVSSWGGHKLSSCFQSSLIGPACAARFDPRSSRGETAGPRAAVLFTILAGAKHHRLEPWAYLRDMLLRLSAGETDLELLLPDRWAASHPEHVLEHRLEETRRKAARHKTARQARRAVAGPTR